LDTGNTLYVTSNVKFTLNSHLINWFDWLSKQLVSRINLSCKNYISSRQNEYWSSEGDSPSTNTIEFTHVPIINNRFKCYTNGATDLVINPRGQRILACGPTSPNTDEAF
jgi:hypothetical protein